ncbi:MAG: hypothetical protein COZ27_00625 [Candidatus Moranbacteria bacterium CG_4_10_14_3_um_filter_41_65]|nr:MAG: hypothetical protein AUK58_03500 [Candidatus Moranbacteria bacterium CG2_30_41_165]PIP25813.1 MAG: hypothetical protein COX32_01430 [Candidatus Moranbacteria bacterium CG23_combo_of_CG06-09_8_20_14_all_41_28]PIV86217.1 MAG: hypothetical protein COW50_02675 [Candidatus Moranbacteria bacterium CG17_big_fil_post_rev_8_21_14_2_50_41_107]PIW94004.1 MAG: hypothetical protein COZ86_03295 [Candidatus Moranbacteria bacterium CG_4_8_14_3_um_filter_41_13]PIX91852.1 MAG: hypothetical protein COZ27_
MKKRNSIKIISYIAVLLVLVLLALYFLHRARMHQQDFRNITATSEIDATMTIGFVVRKFGIPEDELLKELQLSNVHWNKRYTIADACKKNKLDCKAVVDSLNKKVTK